MDDRPRESERRAPSRTRILATLGPATDSPAVLAQLVEAGATMFRLNFSHGTPEEHAARIQAVRDHERDLGRPLAIVGDLPGPKIRIVEVDSGGLSVSVGDEVIFDRRATGPCRSAPSGEPVRLVCTWEGLVDCVQPGDRVLIDDGAIRLLATEATGDVLVCRVTTAGIIRSHKGVNLPDSTLELNVPTPRDCELARWAIDHDVDLVAMSFVRSGEEVNTLREVMRDHQSADQDQRPLPIIAKIEVPPAVAAADDIIAAADAVMVARGDLGVEMDLAAVPVIQKRLLASARSHGRPCIVATQMLQSMIEAPTPTRAEASDVAGAIYDGADAVMLSGETAVGRYPVLAVQTMRRIGDDMETWIRKGGRALEHGSGELGTSDDSGALVRGIWATAEAANVKCIVVYSEWGTWSRLLSRISRPVPIIAYSGRVKVLRQMLLCRGVTPERITAVPDEAVLTQDVVERLRESGWMESGDAVLVVLGRPLQAVINSTRMTVHRLDQEAPV